MTISKEKSATIKRIFFLFYVVLVTALAFMLEGKVAQILHERAFNNIHEFAILFAVFSWSLINYGGMALFYGVDKNGKPNAPN